jgi:hypothetical protein
MPLLQRVTGRREASAAAWEHIGDCPTKMYVEDDQDQYGDDDGDRNLSYPWVWILPA